MVFKDKTVLLVEDESEVRDVVRISLEMAFECTVLEAENVTVAIEIIKKKGDSIDLITSDHNMPGHKGVEILEYLTSENLQVPFVLMSAHTPGAEYNSPLMVGMVEKPCIIEPLEALVLDLFSKSTTANGTQPSEPVKDDREYLPVALSMLLKMDSLAYDVFLKLSDMKYIKVANAGDDFDVLDAKHFFEKKITHLFLRPSDARRFVNDLSRLLVLVSEDEGLTSEEDIAVTVDTHEVIHGLSQYLGFEEEVARLTNKSINLAIRAAKKSPKICKLINEKMINRNSYISSHSMITAYIACGLALQMEWSSKFTYVKLAMSAVLHDLTLKETDFASIQKLTAKAREGVEQSDKKLKKFMKHPAEAAALLDQLDLAPPDVDVILIQHEERPDGSGFPHQLTHQRLNPLSALFIFAEDIANFLFLEGKTATDIGAFLNENKDLYNRGHFKKVFELLSQSGLTEDDDAERLIA